MTAPGWRKSDFNPRSREGSDFLQPVRRLYCKISIHAPARGATGGSETAGNTVSIFQSTLPRGKRLRLTRKQIYSIFISIHAPARGATIFAPATEPAAFISIHAPARGATGGSETAGNTVSIFQSTLPRGKRLRLTRKQIYSIFISIHAPARGATIFAPATEPAAFISIHAPARGATDKSLVGIRDGIISIHAPARGATWYGRVPAVHEAISIHAPARGATSG